MQHIRHPIWWVISLALILLVIQVVWALVTSPNLDWGIVGNYLFAPPILAGIGMTLYLTVICLAIGVVLGLVIALMRLSPLPVPSTIASGFIWFFRGVPPLVQLIFWFNLGLLFPQIGLNVPFIDTFVGVQTNMVISAVTAAILGLGLNEAAYMAEIIRGGINSVDAGQRDAAKAIGLTPFKTLMKIVLPQAFRVAIPPASSEVNMMLKGTSLVSVLGVTDLLNSARHVYAVNLRTIELLVVATIWYLVLVSLLTVAQHFLERKYSRGYAQRTPRRQRTSRRTR